MPEPRPEVIDFLRSRRSRPAKTLGPDGPGRDELMDLLTVAARVPDHKKLHPWRFVVIGDAARERLATVAATRLREMRREADIDKLAGQILQGGVVVAVISAPVETRDVPVWEQQSSAACVCYGLLIAALAAGWGAQWLTGPLCRDPAFLSALGCTGAETVAGFIHIGSEKVAPSERERPDVEALTEWA